MIWTDAAVLVAGAVLGAVLLVAAANRVLADATLPDENDDEAWP